MTLFPATRKVLAIVNANDAEGHQTLADAYRELDTQDALHAPPEATPEEEPAQ